MVTLCNRCGQEHAVPTIDLFCSLQAYDLDTWRRIPDNDLTSEFDYLLRELCEAGTEGIARDEYRQIQVWRLGCITREYDRRMELSERGGPCVTTLNIPASLLTEIKSRVTGAVFADIFSRLTGFEVLPQSNRDRWRYRCHAHGEDRDPSGLLYLQEARYHCFACGGGGDVFELPRAFPPHLGFVDAVQYVASFVGIDISIERMPKQLPAEARQPVVIGKGVL